MKERVHQRSGENTHLHAKNQPTARNSPPLGLREDLLPENPPSIDSPSISANELRQLTYTT
jgi:hypothetical protein